MALAKKKKKNVSSEVEKEKAVNEKK